MLMKNQTTTIPDRRNLPTGTLTFLLTDIESSTQLWESYPDSMKAVLARHDELIESSVESHHGQVVKPRGEGDSRFAVFQLATDAVLAAMDIQQLIWGEGWRIPEPIRVRIALHTGEAELRENDYYGPTINRCARLRNLAHGGQILLSQVTYGLVNEFLSLNGNLRELGEYKLKDIKRPERIYQVTPPGVPANFQPLKTSQRSIHNLPASLTSFIGRKNEIKELKRLLSKKRIITIAGVGGAGKTRLAQQVASESLEDYSFGGWFIDLAPLSDPSLVPQYIMNSIGIHEDTRSTPVEVLIFFFQGKSALLILDNCEHVLAGVVQMAQAIIGELPDLKILATSREPLGLVGETVWWIPQLSTPPMGENISLVRLLLFESVRLFVERAVTANPGFTLNQQNSDSVAQICARLDGIPLAIELAAARARVLSAVDIAARLDNRFQFLTSNQNVNPRQKTLRNLIDWSHELLPKSEQALLRRLAVFSGGWTLEAAEKVCYCENINSIEILDLLSHLVDKSLVIAEITEDSERYNLLETIRQYAQERLAESKETDIYLFRHAEYFTNLVEQAYVDMWGRDQAEWFEKLEADFDNLRSAMEWMAGNQQTNEMYLRMSGSMWRFWRIRGHISEGRTRLEDALKKNPYAAKDLIANALRGASKLALQQGDYTQAAVLAQDSLEKFRNLNDKLGVARQLDVLGEVSYYQGLYTQAVELHTESLALKYEINDKEGIAVSLRQLGVIARDRGDYRYARELFEESLKLFRELEDKIFIAQTLNNYGLVEHSLCNYEIASALFEEAVSIYRQLNDRVGISNTLQNLGNLAKDQGELIKALSIYDECLKLKQALGDKRGITQAQTTRAEVVFYQGKYNVCVQIVEQSLNLFQELGVKRGIVFSLGLLAYCAQYQGNLEKAISLAEQCLKISIELNAPRPMAYCKEVLGLVAYSKNNLGEARELLDEAIQIFDKYGDRRNVASAKINLARTAYREEDMVNGIKLLEDCLEIAQELNLRWVRGLALEILGLFERNQGNLERALELFQESLRISINQDNRQGIVNSLGAIAGLAALANHPAEAVKLFAVSQKERDEIGAKMGEGDLREYNKFLSMAHQNLDEEQYQTFWSQGYNLTTEQALEVATLNFFTNFGKDNYPRER